MILFLFSSLVIFTMPVAIGIISHLLYMAYLSEKSRIIIVYGSESILKVMQAVSVNNFGLIIADIVCVSLLFIILYIRVNPIKRRLK